MTTPNDKPATQAMLATADWINSLGVPCSDKPVVKVRMHMDGSGIPKPEIVKP